MYTQGLDVQGPDSAGPGDERVLEQRFLARVDAEEKIEPKDWMPARYRNTLDPANLPACPFGDRRHAA